MHNPTLDVLRKSAINFALCVGTSLAMVGLYAIVGGHGPGLRWIFVVPFLATWVISTLIQIGWEKKKAASSES